MTAIVDFMKHPLWLDTATGWWIVLGLGVIVEWALGRAKSVKANSMAALVANGLRLVFVRVGLMRLPVVGPLIIHGLEVFSGVDLDGDGKVGDKPPGPPAPPAVALLLALGLLPSLSCAHVEKFADCAGPEVAEFCSEWKPRAIEILTCSELSPELLPPCVAAGLVDAYHDHGAVLVDCALIAIRDAFSAPPNATPAQLERARLIRARAAALIKAEESRGIKFVRPAT